MMHGPLWSPARHEGPPPRQSVSVAWTLAFGQPEDRTPTHVYDTRGRYGGVREELAAAVKKSPGCSRAFKKLTITRNPGIKVP
jgi:hypothetical protein